MPVHRAVARSPTQRVCERKSCIVFNRLIAALPNANRMMRQTQTEWVGVSKLTVWCIIESGSAADPLLKRLMDDSSSIAQE